jgi:ribose/xylose/arabinose/galactoside ABC-type transport system permease subunit
MDRIKAFISGNVAMIGLAAIIIVGAAVSPIFLSLENVRDLLRSASIMGLVSIGMTFVILCGSIDLSVSSVFSLSCYFFTVLGNRSPALAIAVPILVGIAVGLLNGFIINKMSIPPFVGTLATMLLIRGLVLALSNNATIYKGALPPALSYIGRGMVTPYISFPLVLFVLITLAVSFVMKRRYIGRAMYIVGGNVEAAKLMGVSVRGTMYTAHALCGCMASLGGIVFASRVGSSYPLAGNGYELYAIAAVVIGGAQLNGGIGKISGTFFGSLIMGSFSNIFRLQKLLDPLWEHAIVGSVLLIVIMLQSLAEIYGSARKKGSRNPTEPRGGSVARNG